jgi:hypothetical protein
LIFDDYLVVFLDTSRLKNLSHLSAALLPVHAKNESKHAFSLAPAQIAVLISVIVEKD